jgi:hypothetical protein
VTTVLVVACALLWLRVGVAASRHWWAAESERLTAMHEEFHGSVHAPDKPCPWDDAEWRPEGVPAVLTVLGEPLYWCGPGIHATGRAVRRYVTGEDA